MKSFRDPISNMLKAFGTVESNAPGDLARDEPDDFNLESGKWKLVDDTWQPYVGDMKATKRAEVNAECDRRMGLLVAGYPEYEQKTFAKQEAEARAYIADASSPTPLIDSLATNRGIDKAELVSRILAKVDPFAVYSGMVIGYRQKLEDQINAASDADLWQIDPLAGWPE